VSTYRSLFIIALLIPAACSKSPAAQGNQAAPAGAAQPAQASVASASVTGPVLETMDASTYTYVRVGTSSGDIWAAAQQFPVKVGDRVVVPLETPMRNFHSESLKRDFPVIYFAAAIRHEGEAPAQGAGPGAAPAMMSSHGSSAAAAQPPAAVSSGPVEKAPDGLTVAEVWRDRKNLVGRTVTVRGRVVKFNGGIMDRNWLHLQDGSGKADDSTNDLTVTTGDGVAVGDVITVTGTIAIDKDFTAGYVYPVTRK